MAPEQWSGAPVDGRTDQFAFCLSLWEAFYGERPFSGREMRIIREQVLTGDRVPPPPGSRVPAWLRKVLERGLSTDPAQRWPSMDDLLAALASHRTRRRRTFIGAGAVAFAVAVVATVGVGRWSAARQAAACAAAGESIHEVWNDEVRQRPAAAAAPFIDRFAERWQAARSAACTRGLADPGWSPELAARAEECLQDARVQLESSLAVLAGDDPAAARNAVEVVADMPELGPCLDAPHLARRPGLPAGDAALALRRELAEVRARHAAGVHHDALARVQDLLPRVDALDWAPLTVQSRMLAAAVAEDPRQVEAWLLEALVGATRGGDMTTAGDAAAALAEVVGSRLADHEEGLRWGRLAYALVVAQGDAESLRAARMLHPLADNYLGVGDHEGAENLYRRALELWQRLAPDHPGHARTQVRLADLHRLRGRLDRAAEMYGQALELRLRVLGSEHPDVAAALASLAAVAFEAGDLDAAELRHAEALALRERVLGPQHPDVARSLAELAAVHGARSRFDAAEQLLERSLEILEQALGPDHLDLTATLLRLAEVLERRGEHARAVAAYARSLAIGEKARGRDHLDNARPLLGLGLVELARGRSAEAVRHLDRARLLFARGGQAVEAARAQIALAQALWARRGARPRARELAEQARTTLCSAGVPGPCYAARTWLAEHV